MDWTVDAHCHWSDSRLIQEADVRIPELVKKGVLAFQLGGVDPEEWGRQTLLQEKFPGRFWRAFGLHPYFVAQNPPEILEHAWAELVHSAPTVEMLGEVGLDFRKTYLAAGKERQLEFFKRQLQLAKQLQKPVILHIVRAHEEALAILREHNPPGMVHAFTAGPKVAKRYLDLGYSLSIGAKLLRPDTQDLRATVENTPIERLLIESDWDSGAVLDIAKSISELKKLPFSRVLGQTRANLLTLIKRDFTP